MTPTTMRTTLLAPPRVRGVATGCAVRSGPRASVRPEAANASGAVGASRRHRHRSSRVVPALVEPEWRVGVGHEARIRDDPRHPPIEAEHEVEETARIPRHEQERYSGEEHERPDQTAAVPPMPPAPVLSSAGSGASTAEEDSEQDVVRDREQPPLHEHEPARESLRVSDVESGRVVGRLVERERRVAVGAQRAVRVERHAPSPAQYAEVEVENAPRVAAGEQDREEGDDREHDEGDPEEEQHDVVRNRQQPLHEPEPSAQLRIQAALEPNRVGGSAFHPRTSSMLPVKALLHEVRPRDQAPPPSSRGGGWVSRALVCARACAIGRGRRSGRGLPRRGPIVIAMSMGCLRLGGRGAVDTQRLCVLTGQEEKLAPTELLDLLNRRRHHKRLLGLLRGRDRTGAQKIRSAALQASGPPLSKCAFSTLKAFGTSSSRAARRASSTGSFRSIGAYGALAQTRASVPATESKRERCRVRQRYRDSRFVAPLTRAQG